MNFIGKNQHMVLLAQGADPGELLPAPDFSGRVLRIAEDHHGGQRIGKLFFQVLKVHLILSVPVDERILEHPAPVVDDGIDEGVVNRRLDDDLLRGSGEFPHCGGQGGNDPGGEDQLFIADLQAVVLSPPVPVGVEQFVRKDAVAENPVGSPLLNRPADAGCGGEIHIRHPHGQFIFRNVPFQGTGSAPVDNFIKTVIHFFSTFFTRACRESPASLRCHCR